LLQATGAGLLGTSGFSQTGAAKDSSGGDKIWEFETGDQVRAAPTVVNDTVFVGSWDERLYAINAADGTEQWSFSTSPSGGGSFGPIAGAPAVVDQTVYVGTNMRGFGRVYAINDSDGSKEWQYKTGSRVYTSPTVVDGTVFVGNDGGSLGDPAPNLYALDADDGSELWIFQTENNIRSSPTVVDETVYFGSDNGQIYAVETTDGTERWSTSLGQWPPVRSSPTVVDGTVYVGCGDRDGKDLYALNAEDGSIQWGVNIGRGTDSSPTVIEDTLYIGNTDQHIYAVNTDDGSVLWSFKTNNTIISSPTVAGNVVYVGSQDGSIYALDRTDGSERWTFDGQKKIRSSPTVVDGTVYVGSGITRCCEPGDGEGTVYALNAGIEGSGNGSRVLLGSLGHHHIFAGQGPTGPGVPVSPEPETEITGIVTDTAGNPLRDIEVRAENQETDEQVSTTTDSDGEYELAVEPSTEYRVFVFDQFGLKQIEFEEFVQLEEDGALEISITLFSKFEVFKEQKLGSDRIAGLAPRIDNISTPLISEEQDVESEINVIEDAVNSGDVDQALADEAIERMVLGEAIVNRALEGLTDATPVNLAGYDWSQGPLLFEDEMPNFDLLFQTSKGLVIGLIEASYSLKQIANEALGEFGNLVIDRINNAIGNFLRDRLSDYQRVLGTAENALSIEEMLLEIKEAADDAIERLDEGATFDNKRSVIKDLADPIAEQIANSLLVGAELLSIEGQLSALNTILSADSLANNPTFENDIESIVDETRTSLGNIGTKVQQADDEMNPESDALKKLLDLVRELSNSGSIDIPTLLNSIWEIVRDLVGVISSGFNIGYGIVQSRDIYAESGTVVNDITRTV
jgi:outer membrane protein assembly factor BamB